MRRTAPLMLVLMAAIFAASHWAIGAHPQWATGLGYVNAFAEAAMVGGLADWFGEAPARTEELSTEVSALRKQLGPLLERGQTREARGWLEEHEHRSGSTP